MSTKDDWADAAISALMIVSGIALALALYLLCTSCMTEEPAREEPTFSSR